MILEQVNEHSLLNKIYGAPFDFKDAIRLITQAKSKGSPVLRFLKIATGAILSPQELLLRATSLSTVSNTSSVSKEKNLQPSYVTAKYEVFAESDSPGLIQLTYVDAKVNMFLKA